MGSSRLNGRPGSPTVLHPCEAFRAQHLRQAVVALEPLEDAHQAIRVDLHDVPRRLALARLPYSSVAIRSFIGALSSASSAYIRFSLALSASSSFTRLSSDASSPPRLLFHL